MPKLNTESRVALNRLLTILNTFRDLYPTKDVQIGEVISLLLIALGETQDGGLTVTDLKNKGEFALATASRYMHSLSDADRNGNPGHLLVTGERDPKNDSRKILRVTPKGSLLLSSIVNTITAVK